MVTIMTLLIVCAVFATFGGLAFTEVRSLQFKLQEKQRQYGDAITAIDVYRARVEAVDRRYKASCRIEVCDRYLEELKALRVRINELDKETK